MRATAAIVLAFGLASAAAQPSAPWPKDVAQYLERRASCDHWRGEPAYDEHRRAQIQWAMCQSCSGSDAGLARLKRKYSSDARVMARLDRFEPEIEAGSDEERRGACEQVKKPNSR